MTHPTDDVLLLAAYGELAAPTADDVAAHVAVCAACGDRFARLERARVALDVSARPIRRRRRFVVLGGALAAAAVLTLVLLRGRPETSGLSLVVPRYALPELAPIDSLLTRLEQGRSYALP